MATMHTMLVPLCPWSMWHLCIHVHAQLLSVHVHVCSIGYTCRTGMLLMIRVSTLDCSVLIDTWLAWNGLTCQLAQCI